MKTAVAFKATIGKKRPEVLWMRPRACLVCGTYLGEVGTCSRCSKVAERDCWERPERNPFASK